MSAYDLYDKLSSNSAVIVDIKELKLLGDFNHPNIVRFVSAFFSSLTLQSLMVEIVARC